MKKIIAFLIFTFSLSSCLHDDSQKPHHQVISNNLNQIELKNFKTFIKIPKSYNLNSNFKSKKIYFDDLNLLSNGALNSREIYGFFGLSDALICDLRRNKINKDFKKIQSYIKSRAISAFIENNNLGKKYEFEIYNEELKINGFFLIKKIFKNQNNQICKNFQYEISDFTSSFHNGRACQKNDVFWEIEYDSDQKKYEYLD
jgi:hypothetical protein